MLTIRRILFPTDYSACAEGAFTHAAYLADRYEAELHLLHVTESSGDPMETCFDDFPLTPADLAADLHLPIPERDDRPADEPVRIISAEKSGPDPAPVILRYAEEHDIDLIVMGTHGRRGLRRMMVGSVAEEVVRLAPCPVFTVRAYTTRDDDMDAWVIRRVLAPVDLSARSALAARHAVALAAVYGAELDLLYVLDTVSLPAGPYDAIGGVAYDGLSERAEEGLAALADELQQEVPTMEGHVSTHLRLGHVVGEILGFAEASEADLLVLGSHGHTGIERFLMGSVATQLVRSASCPVFTLKSFGKGLVAPKVPSADARVPSPVA